MISTPLPRLGAVIFMSLTLGLSGGVLAKQSETAARHHSQIHKAHGKSTTGNKKAYSRNSVSDALPDLRKYPSGTPRKKAFLRIVTPVITHHNAVITAERNWLISKRYEGRWSPSERVRLQGMMNRYKVKWSGNTRYIPWDRLLERVDIIPASMAATMAAVESGWGTSALARSNNNLFGMRCSQRNCNSEPGKVKGYLHYTSLKEAVNAYAMNLNTHPTYDSFRKSRAQLRHNDQDVTASKMIHKLEGYSTKGKSYNNFLFAMYQDNRNLMAAN